MSNFCIQRYRSRRINIATRSTSRRLFSFSSSSCGLIIVLFLFILTVSNDTLIINAEAAAADKNIEPSLSLRGSLYDYVDYIFQDDEAVESSSPLSSTSSSSGPQAGSKNMAEIRRLLQSQSTTKKIDTYSHYHINRHNNSTSSSSSAHEKLLSWWSSLSNSDLGNIAHDTSSLDSIAHRAWGAAYISGRGRRELSAVALATANHDDDDDVEEENNDIPKIIEEENTNIDNKNNIDNNNNNNNNGGHGGESESWSITSFLRGNTYTTTNTNNNKAKKLSPQPPRKLQSSSTLSWTTHTGNDNSIPPNPNNDDNDNNEGEGQSLLFTDMEEYEASIFDSPSSEVEEASSSEEEEEDLMMMSRLQNAIQIVNELNVNVTRYDTNTKYSYSDPTTAPTNNNETTVSSSKDPTDNNNNNTNTTMEQYSHSNGLQSSSQRQRLLTGSYAAWQWYDRSSLATPTNLNLQKVSRVNYAFFQSNDDGYIFGTDSWADPNVLFGPYDFGINSDDLPNGCKGGKGRDDGLGDGYWSGNTDDDHGGGGGNSAASGWTRNAYSLPSPYSTMK